MLKHEKTHEAQHIQIPASILKKDYKQAYSDRKLEIGAFYAGYKQALSKSSIGTFKYALEMTPEEATKNIVKEYGPDNDIVKAILQLAPQYK